MINNNHGNFYLQKDFNSLGKKYFKFEVVQKIEPESITITQAKLLMLENAYINYYLDNNEEIYNIEDTLYEVLAGRKKLQLSEEIANEVVISNFLRYKYLFDPIDKIFMLKKRDTLENIILDNSSIRSQKKAQEVANTIFQNLKSQNLYEQYTYETIFDLYMYHKLQKRIITEVTDLGRQYIIKHFNFDSYLIRKHTNKSNTFKSKVQKDIDIKDKNKIQDVWRTLKNNNILPLENKYNEFREFLINMKLITIDENRNTCATEFALNNKYFLIYAYNSGKDKFQYYISDKGIKYIQNTLSTII